MSIRCGVVGASGYTGVELLRILTTHPEFDVVYLAAGRSAGENINQIWPALSGLLDQPVVSFEAAAAAAACDVVFLALPHGISASHTPALLAGGCTVVDLGADFRLKDAAVYERHYRVTHPCPELLSQAVYGLVELTRADLPGARLIANPGCYPTATTLAAWPLVKAGFGHNWLVADCVSGVSGAGRKAVARNLFCEVAETVKAYSPGGKHRHVPEIEQTLGVTVVFTPHLVPMKRGMLATVHVPVGDALDFDGLRSLYHSTYADDSMVVIRDDQPATGDAVATNRAHIGLALDRHRGVATITCAIDNLVKGAAGQAIQAANVALGLPEAAGLPLFPVLP